MRRSLCKSRYWHTSWLLANHTLKPTMSVLKIDFTPKLDIAFMRPFLWLAGPYIYIMQTLYFLANAAYDSNSHLFLYWVGVLSSFITTVSILISLRPKISSSTWTKLRSWRISSLKWYTNLISPGYIIVQCIAYCFPKKCASCTSFFAFRVIFSEKSTSIYFPVCRSLILGKTVATLSKRLWCLKWLSPESTSCWTMLLTLWLLSIRVVCS